ncbi:MAG: PAS domain S-box protein, partial [Planctomycetes bacterium]|nr:PAS domain S-box protein [Planctomycetota bacterium]
LMKSIDPYDYGLLLRWVHLPLAVLIFSMVGFVRIYLRAGRPWLAWSVCALRAAALVLDFTTGANLHYRSILDLRRVTLLGEPVTVAGQTVPNHWSRVAELSSVLLLVFVIDAAVTAFRRGERRRAAAAGGALAAVVVIAAVHTALLHLAVIHAPYIVGISCFALVVVLGYQVSMDVLLDTRLVQQSQAREAHVISEERLRLAVEAAPSGMLMVDGKGNITVVNTQVEKIFGYPRHELLGQPIEILVPVPLRNAHSTLRTGYFADAKVRLMGAGRELYGRRKDGSEVPVEIGLNPISTAEGVFILASIVDVTERKRADQEMVLQRNELAHLSRVNMLGELSGSLAHELNQPLTSILSNAQAAQRLLARDGVDPVELREILADIVAEDKRAGEIIMRLRALFTRGEVQRQPMDLNEQVIDVMKLLHSELVSHNITVSMKLQPDLPRLSGDKVQLQQVLINLLVNASDAMGGITEPDGRRVLMRTELNGDGLVHVCVEDSGRGIAAGDIDRIFKPFYTSKGRGMGLGLAVCRSIITAHGGLIWATPNNGRGTCLHFTLPVLADGVH